MKQIRIAAVGKVKTEHWQKAIHSYHKRFSPSLRFQELIVKDADTHLPIPQRIEQEGERLLKLVQPNEQIVCLDEKGIMLGSEPFAHWLEEQWEKDIPPLFIVGGAFGLSTELKKKAKMLLALGKITLPHELARVILYEQIYRAESILQKLPYHHK